MIERIGLIKLLSTVFLISFFSKEGIAQAAAFEGATRDDPIRRATRVPDIETRTSDPRTRIVEEIADLFANATLLSPSAQGTVRITPGERGRMHMEIEYDYESLAREGLRMFAEENHKEAFKVLQLTSTNPEDSISKFHVADYLTYGVEGGLEPTEETRRQAARLYIEAAVIEMPYPDEGGQALRKLEKRRFQEAYHLLREDKREEAIEAVFNVIKDEIRDPF